MKSFLEWVEFHQETLKWASLAVAIVVLGVSFYRWLILKWQNDANLRTYLELLRIEQAGSGIILTVDVPTEQELCIAILNQNSSGVLWSKTYQLEAGEQELQLDTVNLPERKFIIELKTIDHQIMRKVALN